MKIFLSYASQDRAVAESIAFSLRGRGHKVFLDRDNLPPGKSYDEQIESAVNESEIFVFLISPDSVEHGRYSLTELTFARRKWPDPNGRVLPVMVRKTPLEQIPPYLTAVSYLEPVGNIAAETSSTVHTMRPLKERSEEFFVQYRHILGFGSVLGIAAVLLGLGVPFCLAAATSVVFTWLDSNASDEATKVISSWLHGRSRNKPDMGNILLRAFDGIYTSPLPTFKAFKRSSAISTIIVTLLVVMPAILAAIRILLSTRDLEELQNIMDRMIPPALADYMVPAVPVPIALIIFLLIIILSDYISLFPVRYFLSLAKTRPIFASLMSSAVGIVVVNVSYVYFAIFSLISMLFIAVIGNSPLHILEPPNLSDLTPNIVNDLASITTIMRPAFVTHLWLPLFAISSLIVKLLYLILPAVEKAQWFLKQGDAHPFRAIGIVATIIVFGSAMLVKEAWTVL